MNKAWIIAGIIILVAFGAWLYSKQMEYKYYCEQDAGCFPCTRWLNCVSEDFYMKNTGRCRLGAEENFSRMVCGCRQGSCQTLELKPLNKTNVDVWVPKDW